MLRDVGLIRNGMERNVCVRRIMFRFRECVSHVLMGSRLTLRGKPVCVEMQNNSGI